MILLKNARFIGINNLEDSVNLLIDEYGVVTEISNKYQTVANAQELDLSNFFISPGWIDMHTHIYYAVCGAGVDPDIIGPGTGVTVLADAGTSGVANFEGFKQFIIKQKDYPIYSFINIAATGLLSGVVKPYQGMLSMPVSGSDNLDKIDLDGLLDCIKENKNYIKGVKILASGCHLKGWGYEAVKLAKKAASESNLPVMVHIGEPLPFLEDILPLLEKEDIVTHCFHGKKWGIFENNEVIPEVWDALNRGVRFDIGHGCASFNFEVAKKAISSGIKPYSISTDLHTGSLLGPAWSLSLTMSKMLAVGLSLEEVIKMVTKNPAVILEEETYEEGITGKKARFTVFSLLDKDIEVTDTNYNKLLLRKLIKPEYVILNNKIIESHDPFLEREWGNGL